MGAGNWVLRRARGGAPSRPGFDSVDAHKRKPGPVAILEGQRRFAEALDRLFVVDALLDEALRPIADRAFRNAENSFLRFADSEPAWRRVFPGEESEDCSRMARRI